MFAEIKKNSLTDLLYLDIHNYNKYHLIINKKYSNSQPAIFYTALSRGYKSVIFEDMSENILYKLKEVTNED